ncbi:RHS repeat-associated core domain-containing protein [Paenibacillus sp. Marseille-P2973]|uniref:RHS repeat domain-containing protein n=1 Tax=Paenibacillus sp. Marseille-P2973 TaxID=1871032 RepID=UPI001FFC8653|nr:RHS repeat-associated core domain-containing protein [Paenibacillus sp. Marseille-P2973]
MNSRATTFQYAPDNRLLALEDYPVEMDADGNLLYKSNGESMASYEYDARNRLVRSGKALYTYNMLGTRTSMSWRGKTTQYVVDDLGELSRVLMELDEAGTPTAFYVYGLGLIGREAANGNYVSYHSDIRGSTTLLTDEQGSVTDRYTYGIYGELEEHEGSTHQPFQYNGRDGVMTDPNGLYYMRARYYDPQLKRFLNRDVILGDLADGQTLNRFAYVNGDPVGYVDPLGLFKCDVGGKGDSGKFTQTTASVNFSKDGKFANMTNGEVAQKLRNGELQASDLPVEYLMRDGNKLLINTRSSLALKRAGIPESEWTFVNRTGDSYFEIKITERLAKNGLTSAGTDTIRITGAGGKASNLK